MPRDPRARALAPRQAAPGRQLSYTSIAGYMPGSKVTEHNAVDMDQAAMETELKKGTPDFAAAKAIYPKMNGAV